MAKSRPKEVVYHIETVTKGKIEKRTVATGKVEPRNEILIKPQMSGIISEVYKQAGEIVQTGDIIAKIQVVPDMVTLSSAESRLSRAEIAFGSKSPQLRTRQQIIRKQSNLEGRIRKSGASIQKRPGRTACRIR